MSLEAASFLRVSYTATLSMKTGRRLVSSLKGIGTELGGHEALDMGFGCGFDQEK